MNVGNHRDFQRLGLPGKKRRFAIKFVGSFLKNFHSRELFSFNQSVVNTWSKTHGSQRTLNSFFELDESLGAENFLHGTAAEIRNREYIHDLKTSFLKKIFDVGWVIIIKTVLINFLQV